MRVSCSLSRSQPDPTPGPSLAQVIQETCDPEWDELFYFPMQYISLTTDKVVCNLYDHDLGYHEFMGWAEVGLSTLPKLSQPTNEKQKGKATTKDADAQKHDMWLPLALPPGMETSSYWKKYVSFEGDVPVTGALSTHAVRKRPVTHIET